MSLGIYIHVPFCKSKCPYCDFFSTSAKNYDIDTYLDLMIAQIKYWSKKTNDTVDTVYFGGGTPSLLGTNGLEKILFAVCKFFKVSGDAEITTELNPSSGDLLDFAHLKESGFNRLSIGLQSANDNELRLLGRLHKSRDVLLTVKEAQKCGFDNISLDLMIATPQQTEKSLENSIKFCYDLGVSHISSYILKIEENTYYFNNPEKYDFLDDDTQVRLYLFACDKLEEYGYHQYEISNFSHSGAESRHNLKYWNLDPYIGIGPSAHSFFEGKRFYYPRSFEKFVKNEYVLDGEGGTQEEYIMLSLRLSKGISFKEFKNRFGVPFPAESVKIAQRYEKLGLLTVDEKGIRLNKNGFLLSNTIISDLI